MSEKMFTNHGQAIATCVAIASFFVALIANWTAIREHQDLLSWWPVIGMPIAIYVAFSFGRSSGTAVPPTFSSELSKALEPAEVPSEANAADTSISKPRAAPVWTESEKFWKVDDAKTFQRKTVKLGEFWELREGMARLKITPIAIKEVDGKPLRAELRFDTGGSVFYGGDNTVSFGTNRIALAQTSSGFQAEENCAFQFSFSQDHVHFAAARVDHINKFGNEVVLEVCLVSLHKTSKFEWITDGNRGTVT